MSMVCFCYTMFNLVISGPSKLKEELVEEAVIVACVVDIDQRKLLQNILA